MKHSIKHVFRKDKSTLKNILALTQVKTYLNRERNYLFNMKP